MIVCNTCNDTKEDDCFAWKNKAAGKRNGKCKECHKSYVKLHYENNKASYLQSAKASRKTSFRNTKNFISSLKSSGCIVCQETFAPALDFHHIDEKSENVSRLQSKKQIREEVAKCIVLCATCHRKFHYGHTETFNFVNDHINTIKSLQPIK